MKNKKINIKTIFCNSLYVFKSKIEVYEKNKLILSDSTNKCGNFCFEGKINNVYKIIITNCICQKCVVLFVNKNLPNEFTVYFNEFYNKHSITVSLTDRNYEDLPITNGRMILWKIK